MAREKQAPRKSTANSNSQHAVGSSRVAKSTQPVKPPAKRHRLDLDQETIAFRVGTGQTIKSFVVHKSIATKSSKFITAAYNDNMKEGQEARILLPEADRDAFGAYLNWLYTDQVTFDQLDPAPNGPDSFNVQLAWMYILGDYLDDMRFCNAVIDELLAQTHSQDNPLMHGSVIEVVWSHTTRDSPLRGLVLAQWKRCLADPKMVAYLRDCHADYVSREFLIDLLAQVGESHAAALVKEWEEKTTKCQFHRHVDDTDKCD